MLLHLCKSLQSNTEGKPWLTCTSLVKGDWSRRENLSYDPRVECAPDEKPRLRVNYTTSPRLNFHPAPSMRLPVHHHQCRIRPPLFECPPLFLEPGGLPRERRYSVLLSVAEYSPLLASL